MSGWSFHVKGPLNGLSGGPLKPAMEMVAAPAATPQPAPDFPKEAICIVAVFPRLVQPNVRSGRHQHNERMT
jgi:hypothetical protein